MKGFIEAKDVKGPVIAKDTFFDSIDDAYSELLSNAETLETCMSTIERKITIDADFVIDGLYEHEYAYQDYEVEDFQKSAIRHFAHYFNSMLASTSYEEKDRIIPDFETMCRANRLLTQPLSYEDLRAILEATLIDMESDIEDAKSAEKEA